MFNCLYTLPVVENLRAQREISILLGGTQFSDEFNFGRSLGITSFRFMCADAHALLRPAHRRCRRLLAARHRARHRAQHPACARCTSPAAPARARALALSAVR